METGVKRNTKRVGDISELRVMCDLVAAGYLVSIPFGENHRYDLIIEKDFILSRVQVKTGRLRKGVILFNCFSSHAHRGGASCRQYIGEVEFFGVYCPDTDCTYLVPLTDMISHRGHLRLSPVKNGQRKKLKWARDYLLGEGGWPPLVEVGTEAFAEVPASGETTPS
jgi:PD-(D/E)XK endonuclease